MSFRLMKIRFQTWSIGPALFILLGLAFGLLIPLLGYYWDDWPAILTIRTQGLSAFWDFYRGERPFSAWTFIAFAPLLGTNQLLWHLFTLAIRWVTVYSMWWCLRLLWPRRGREVLWSKMKNFFESVSLRRIRLIFSVLFILIFIICTINAEFTLFRYAISNDQCAWREIPGRDTVFLITDITPGGVADKAGIKNGDILVRINGKKITTNYFDSTANNPMTILNSIPKGEYATYLIERDGKLFETTVEMLKVFDIVYASNYLFGLVFLIVGYIVVMTKPGGKTQRMFAYFTLYLMLIFGLSVVNLLNYRFNIAFYILVLCASAISRAFGPSIIINFFYYFPVYKKTRANKIFLIAPRAGGPAALRRERERPSFASPGPSRARTSATGRPGRRGNR